MIKKIFFPLAILNILTMTLIAQEYQWAKSIDASSYRLDNMIEVDHLGNVYLIGHFGGNGDEIEIDFDPGPDVFNVALSPESKYDGYVAKYTSSGEFIWVNTFGGDDGGANYFGAAGRVYPISIKLDNSGNTFVVGYFEGSIIYELIGDPLEEGGIPSGIDTLISKGKHDIFHCKINPEGETVWMQSIGGANYDRPTGLDLDDKGNLYITGSFYNQIDFDPGIDTYILSAGERPNIFVAKYSNSGALIWASNFGGNKSCTSSGIVQNKFGYIYITGSFRGSVDFNFPPTMDSITSQGQSDVFISKFDSFGNSLWTKTIGGSLSEYGTDLKLDKSGHIYLSGNYNSIINFDTGQEIHKLKPLGNSDGFLAKFDSEGKYIYAKSIGLHNTYQYSHTLAIDDSGLVYVTGLYEDVNRGNRVYFSIHNTNGDIIWKGLVGFSGNAERANQSIRLDKEGNIYLAGRFNSNRGDFDPGPGEAILNPVGKGRLLGGHNIFFAKYGNEYFTDATNELNQKNIFSLSPNPAQKNIKIVVDKNERISNAKAVDLLGRIISLDRITTDQFSVANLQNGLYFIVLTLKSGKTLQKEVVIKN